MTAPASRRPATRVLGRLALAACALGAARYGVRLRRALVAFHRAESRLGAEWGVVPGRGPAAGRRLHARRGGPARARWPTVVLVHGLGVGGTYLVPLAARLARHARVLVPDLPGHGGSDAPARPLTVAELAATLGDWCEAHGVRGAILVGHSLGAEIVATLAAERPALAAGLVLLSPAGDPVAAEPSALFVRALGALRGARTGLALWAGLDLLRADRAQMAAEARAARAGGIEATLERVRAPVRIVSGGRDGLAPPRWTRALALVADAPRPRTVPGVGHGLPYDAPDACVAAVAALARGVAREASAARATHESADRAAPPAALG